MLVYKINKILKIFVDFLLRTRAILRPSIVQRFSINTMILIIKLINNPDYGD